MNRHTILTQDRRRTLTHLRFNRLNCNLVKYLGGASSVPIACQNSSLIHLTGAPEIVEQGTGYGPERLEEKAPLSGGPSGTYNNTLHDGMDEKTLMHALTWAIDGAQYHDQLPCRKDGSGGLWQLDCRNDWFAKLTRKGETLHIGEPPAEHDTLEVWHRYCREPLDAIKPWLLYRFSPRVTKSRLVMNDK